MRIAKIVLSTLLCGAVMTVMAVDPVAPPPPDVRRVEAAQALINYQAQLSENQRLNSLREAPGSVNMVATGESLALYGGQSANFSKLLTSLMIIDAEHQLKIPSSNKQLQYYKDNATNPAMIDVSTLIGTKILSLAQQAMAQQLIINITNPNPTTMSTSLSQALKSTPVPLDSTMPPVLELGQQTEFVQREMAQALYSVPQRAFYEVMLARLPIPNAPNGESLLQILEKESTWRMQTPTWFATLAVTPTEGVLREMAQIEAMRLWLQFEQYRQTERTEVLLATLVAAQARLVDQMTAMQQTATNVQSQATSFAP